MIKVGELKEDYLDQVQLAVIKSLDPTHKVLGRLVAVFEIEVAELIQQLFYKFESKNYRDCQYLVHSIKSSALNIGAKRLAGHAADLESRFGEDVVNISYDDVVEVSRLFGYSLTELKGEVNSAV